MLNCTTYEMGDMKWVIRKWAIPHWEKRENAHHTVKDGKRYILQFANYIIFDDSFTKCAIYITILNCTT